MAWCGDSFTSLYVDDVRTSPEARRVTDSFTFLYVDDVPTSQETHYGPPETVTVIALLFSLRRRCACLTGNTYGFPRPVTGIALLFLYVDDIRKTET
jgi:hypothetical protein